MKKSKYSAEQVTFALRNAKRDYLLRGLIFCDNHIGKKGEHRRYYGEPKDKTYIVQTRSYSFSFSIIIGTTWKRSPTMP